MIPAPQAEEMTLEVRHTVGLWLVAGLSTAEMCEALGCRLPPSEQSPIDWVIRQALLAWLRIEQGRKTA